MTEDWDFYLLRVDEMAASIYVDLGARKFAPNPSLPYMAYLRLYMNAPREDGLSSQDEFEALSAIEDLLCAKLIGGETDYVGRCTTNACRDFFFYVAQPQNWVNRVTNCMLSFPTYKYEADTRRDAEWSTYFSYLYPSAVDREKIENRRVCGALEQNGDKLIEAREIDHWTYFADIPSRAAFIADAAQLGFEIRTLSDSDTDGRYLAQLWRSDIPAYNTIDDITLPLFRLAEKHGGEYDGWETFVVI